MMISRRISFSSQEQDDFGMPTTYKSYLVIAREARSDEPNPGKGIARVYPISVDAEALNPDRVVAVGGPDEALEEAFARLRYGKEKLVERIGPSELT